MDFASYQDIFRHILEAPVPPAPYDKPAYLNYARLNQSRQGRWLKTAQLNPTLVDLVTSIRGKQTWIVITEAWCGDAAHSIPFLHLLSRHNPLITEDYQLRDTPPMLIENYLSHGTRSIPKLIIRDTENKDLIVWGPRPAPCQAIYNELLRTHADAEEKKIALQKWYNEDKGVTLQEELIQLLAGSGQRAAGSMSVPAIG